MRNDSLSREGAPREHQEEEVGDRPVVWAQRRAGCPHLPLVPQETWYEAGRWSQGVSGIIPVARRGLRWVDAPAADGSHKILYNRCRRW